MSRHSLKRLKLASFIYFASLALAKIFAKRLFQLSQPMY